MDYKLNPQAITSPAELETDRLILKPISESLREFVFRGLSDPEIRHNMKMPVVNTPEIQEDWWQRFMNWRARGEAAQWCAFFKDNQEYAGLFTLKEIDQHHFRGEIGYSVMQSFWGNGVGTEGARRLMEYAFEEIGLHTLFAVILTANIRSQGIVKRLGFTLEANLRDIHFYRGEFYDLLQFSKINPSHLN